MSALRAAFRKGGKRSEPALVAYVTAGDPSLRFTESLVLRLVEAGADVIELGVPFSDPVADGPVIQRASERALRRRTTLAGILKLVARLRRRTSIPLVLFGYLNPVLQFGVERFARRAAAVGVDAVLITDLSPEESDKFVPVMRRAGLETVFLVAPTSTNDRLRLIGRLARGFVYVISRRGTTGMQQDVSTEVRRLVRRVRRHSRLPVAVGFGIAHRRQVEVLRGVADGVVVGSALMDCCERHGHGKKALAAAAALTRRLKGLS